jgi:hypothetical protein
MSEEHRRAERKQLKRFLTVLDGSTSKPLGRIVDISDTGLMLIGSTPLPADTKFLLDIQIPRQSKTLSLRLPAISVWSRNSGSNQSHHGCGMRFDNPSPEQLLLLERLILADTTLC